MAAASRGAGDDLRPDGGRPSVHPDLFPTEKAQEKERQRLFQDHRRVGEVGEHDQRDGLAAGAGRNLAELALACAENADHPRANELFDRYKLPAFHDPFAGGGALPLEAQRLGLEACDRSQPGGSADQQGHDRIPPKFAGKPPVNPEARKEERLLAQCWHGAQGLAEDVRYYGQWMRDQAENRIGHLYPKVEITAADGRRSGRPEAAGGAQAHRHRLAWARTVKSPNPAFAQVDVPLASTFMLSTKAGKEAYVEPVIEGGGYRFTVKVGKPKNAETAKNGTKLSRGRTLSVDVWRPISGDYIKAEAKAGRIGARLMAIVAEAIAGGFISANPGDGSRRRRHSHRGSPNDS